MANNQGNQGNKGDQGNKSERGGQSKQSGSQGSASGTSNRGFASMDPERQREIASEGGRAAHEKGTAHEFTSEEARRAGSMSHGNAQSDSARSGPSKQQGSAEQSAQPGSKGGGAGVSSSGGGKSGSSGGSDKSR